MVAARQLRQLENQSVQVLVDGEKNPLSSEFWSFAQSRGFILPTWGTRESERMLRLLYRHEYNWLIQAATAGQTKKLQAQSWEIKGKQRVRYYQDVLRQADFGLGWDYFLAKGALDYFRQDGGWYFEIIAPGNPRRAPTGPATGIAYLDSLRCYPTGDPEFPVIYHDRDGVMHLMHHTRVRHIVDMPDGDESNPGYGICALRRAISIAAQQIHMGRFIEAKLDDKPEPGYVFWKGISREQRINRTEQFRQEQQRDGHWGNVIHFESLDPTNPVEAEFVSFSQSPEGWSYKEYTELHVNAVAAAFGIDVQELWQLTGGNLGSGQQSQVLHAKSQGKTFGNLLTQLERAINDILPESLEFQFKRHDPYEAQERAQTAQLWAGVASAVQNNMTPNEKRVLLANMVEAIKDAITDESGEIVRLTDADVHPEGDEQTVDDAKPQDGEQPAPQQPEQTADSQAQKDVQGVRLDFEGDFSDLIQAARGKDVERRRFGIIARDMIRRYGMQAYTQGLMDGGVEDGQLDDDDRKEFTALLARQSAFVSGFGDELYKEGGITDTEAESRASLWWSKSVSPFYDAGLLSADRNGLYQWVLGSSEEHCPTCQKMSGQKHRIKDYMRKGIMPRSDKLACRGFNCTCTLVKVSGRASGRFVKGYPEFNPNQPRDAHGQWSDSGDFIEESVDAITDEADVAMVSYEMSDEWQYELTSRERNSVLKYANDDYREINGYLRGNVSIDDEDELEEMTERIRSIDAALRKGGLDENRVLYRGISDSDFARSIQEGDRFVDSAYMSTSLDERIAAGFADSTGSGRGSILRISAQTGQPGAFLGALTDNQHEAEFLLPRGTQLRITRVEQSGDGYTIDAEIVR
jgi:hypothetical protein